VARGHGEKLSRRREVALAALLTSPSVTAAAEAVGVSEKTLRNWLHEVSFAGEYRARRREVVEHAVGVLQRAAAFAAGTLDRNMTCGAPAVEVRAAAIVLEQSLKAVELTDLAERVEQLERLAKEAGIDEKPAPKT